MLQQVLGPEHGNKNTKANQSEYWTNEISLEMYRLTLSTKDIEEKIRQLVK